MTIVVGYVDSDSGRAATEAGFLEAELRGAPLYVVHCSRLGVKHEHPHRVARYQQQLAVIEERLHEHGLEGGAELRLSGRDPAAMLVRVLDEQNAQLLVIGSRRRSAVGKLFMGGTSQQLLLRASCAVLQVPAGRGASER